MSEKKFTPYEVAVEILKKSQEVFNKHKEVAKSAEMEKCGETKIMAKADEKTYSGAPGDVDPKIISDMKNTLADAKANKSKKLPEFLKKKKLKKADLSSMPGSVAQTGGPSIASQIGFGKEEKK
jgi:hypothetical protein